MNPNFGVGLSKYIFENAKGTSPTMKKISQSVVTNIPFPSQPCLEKQKMFINYIDKIQDKINTLRMFQIKTNDKFNALLSAIFDRTFIYYIPYN